MPVHHLSSSLSGCGVGGCGVGAFSPLSASSLFDLAAACILRAQLCITFLVTADARLLATWAAVVFTPCLATVSAALAAAAEISPSSDCSAALLATALLCSSSGGLPPRRVVTWPAFGISAGSSLSALFWRSSFRLPRRFKDVLANPGGVPYISPASATCAARSDDLGILGLAGSAAAAERLACWPLHGGLTSAGGADAPLPCWGNNIPATGGGGREEGRVGGGKGSQAGWQAGYYHYYYCHTRTH